jgi:hypothetical protein
VTGETDRVYAELSLARTALADLYRQAKRGYRNLVAAIALLFAGSVGMIVQYQSAWLLLWVPAGALGLLGLVDVYAVEREAYGQRTSLGGTAQRMGRSRLAQARRQVGRLEGEFTRIMLTESGGDR